MNDHDTMGMYKAYYDAKLYPEMLGQHLTAGMTGQYLLSTPAKDVLTFHTLKEAIQYAVTQTPAGEYRLNLGAGQYIRYAPERGWFDPYENDEHSQVPPGVLLDPDEFEARMDKYRVMRSNSNHDHIFSDENRERLRDSFPRLGSVITPSKEVHQLNSVDAARCWVEEAAKSTPGRYVVLVSELEDQMRIVFTPEDGWSEPHQAPSDPVPETVD